VANTLAYYGMATITVVKSFIVQGPDVHTKNTDVSKVVFHTLLPQAASFSSSHQKMKSPIFKFETCTRGVELKISK
jgi:hypothetical protein